MAGHQRDVQVFYFFIAVVRDPTTVTETRKVLDRAVAGRVNLAHNKLLQAYKFVSSILFRSFSRPLRLARAFTEVFGVQALRVEDDIEVVRPKQWEACQVISVTGGTIKRAKESRLVVELRSVAKLVLVDPSCLVCGFDIYSWLVLLATGTLRSRQGGQTKSVLIIKAIAFMLRNARAERTLKLGCELVIAQLTCQKVKP